MTLDKVITAVQGILAAVPGIGRVHGYVPYVKDDTSFKALFKSEDTGNLLAWTITRTETQSSAQAVHSDQDLHTLTIRGYMSLNNAQQTETTFQALVETVRSTFRANRKLNDGSVNNCFWSEPISCAVTHGVFGSVLCHYAELRLTVKEYPLNF